MAKKPDKPYLYRDYVKTISKRFVALLSYIEGVYGFDYGDEFEVALCQVLRSALPQRFGICRGHVMSSDGNEAGDDIIIYDRQIFPTLRLLPQEDYSRKEWVPIEAVCAYIEAKHTLILDDTADKPKKEPKKDTGKKKRKKKNQQSLSKALHQVGAVRTLCASREPVSIETIARHATLAGVTIPWDDKLPRKRNPFYSIIMAHKVKLKANGAYLEDPEEIRNALGNRSMTPPDYADLIVCGQSNLVVPAVMENGDVKIRMFLHGDDIGCVPLIAKRIAFGTALTMLLAVLNMLQLGDLPWDKIVGDALSPDRHYLKPVKGGETTS